MTIYQERIDQMLSRADPDEIFDFLSDPLTTANELEYYSQKDKEEHDGWHKCNDCQWCTPTNTKLPYPVYKCNHKGHWHGELRRPQIFKNWNNQQCYNPKKTELKTLNPKK